MADGRISQIKLPDDKVYDIKDAHVTIDSEYVAANYEVILTVGSSDD